MKKILSLILLFPFLLYGQSSQELGLFEVVNLKIKMGQEKAFEAAVKSHNMEYHKDGTPYKAVLFYIVNGPNGGGYSWVMGPTNFAAMDTRPTEGAHDEDWAKVASYIESADSPKYWSRDFDLSFTGTNTSGNKSLVWIYDITTGKYKRWSELVSQVREVYEQKRPDESFLVFWNEFSDTKAGQDVAIVFPFEKWAWLDRDANFGKDFEAVHGENTWDNFLDEMRECFDGRTDFLRERID